MKTPQATHLRTIMKISKTDNIQEIPSMAINGQKISPIATPKAKGQAA
jgi:hypothetical protein